MSLIRVLKAASAPVVWLSKYLLRGLTIIGLGAHATSISTVEQSVETPTSSPAGLSHDERLWEAELAADDAGAC